MLLAIDVGNTNITLGVFDGDSVVARGRLATDVERLSDEYGLLIRQLLPIRGIDPSAIDSVSMCSVVPPLTASLVEVCQEYFGVEPLVVGADVQTGIRILYDSPRDVGADRIVDAAAALHLYGGPAIVVDVGTATVLDAVRADGDYLGGAIAPGIALAADTLFRRTSMLRRVELSAPPAAIGENTIHAIQSGLILGYAELIKGMVGRFDAELGGGSKVIATGGLAGVVADEVGLFDAVDPDLTLVGLRIIYKMNVDIDVGDGGDSNG